MGDIASPDFLYRLGGTLVTVGMGIAIIREQIKQLREATREFKETAKALVASSTKQEIINQNVAERLEQHDDHLEANDVAIANIEKDIAVILDRGRRDPERREHGT